MSVPPTGKPDKTRWVGKIADADGCACDDDDGDFAHARSDPTSPRVGKIAATAFASRHAVLGDLAHPTISHGDCGAQRASSNNTSVLTTAAAISL
jgi:hypothetical protein